LPDEFVGFLFIVKEPPLKLVGLARDEEVYPVMLFVQLLAQVPLEPLKPFVDLAGN
jgi:hypothetical protein